MKKVGLVALMSLLVVGLATVAFGRGGGAYDCGRGPAYGACAGGEMGQFRNLNLTAEQTEKIRALREAQWKETKSLRDKMFSKRGDLKLLWLEKNPNQDKILAAQKELRDLRGQMEDKMTQYRLAVYKLLTPEQQNQLQSYGGKRMGRGHGGGWGGPGGAW